MRTIINIALLFLCSTSLALDSLGSCFKFNSTALQLAMAQTGMQSPLNFEQLQSALGKIDSSSTTVITTYTWTHNNRILLVKVTNSDITTKLLTGKDDGSNYSKKMGQIYENLKTATSVWSIKPIERDLGPARTTSEKLQNYIWTCGMGTLEATVNQNGDLTAATISYKTYKNKEEIDAQFGFNHPKWDIETNSLGETYRAWKRNF